MWNHPDAIVQAIGVNSSLIPALTEEYAVVRDTNERGLSDLRVPDTGLTDSRIF